MPYQDCSSVDSSIGLATTTEKNPDLVSESRSQLEERRLAPSTSLSVCSLVPALQEEQQEPQVQQHSGSQELQLAVHVIDGLLQTAFLLSTTDSILYINDLYMTEKDGKHLVGKKLTRAQKYEALQNTSVPPINYKFPLQEFVTTTGVRKR